MDFKQIIIQERVLEQQLSSFQGPSRRHFISIEKYRETKSVATVSGSGIKPKLVNSF